MTSATPISANIWQNCMKIKNIVTVGGGGGRHTDGTPGSTNALHGGHSECPAIIKDRN